MLAPNAMPAPQSVSVVVECSFPGQRAPYVFTSLWEQRETDLEIILVNRDARGGSHEWIRAGRDKIAAVVEAPGASAPEAMNRGLALATKEWVLFLGPADRLVGELILNEVLHFMKDTEAAVAIGEVARDDGHIFKFRSRASLLGRQLAHRAGTFYRRSLFAENGGFEPAFGDVADYEYHLRLWKSSVRFKSLPLRIAACEASKEKPARWPRCQAEIRARRRYYSARRSWKWDLLSLVRVVTG
ncbi:MAG: hypothetical protein RLZZ15_861 [Verrucomicrobiota bacterium]|jgi:GT2 family glycosyltransferase